VHPAPAGVPAAEHGVNTTSAPDNVYTPSPFTVLVVNVQPDGGESAEQNLTVGDVTFAPVDATSFDFTEIVCTAP
jgi:hypothetical protein